MTPELKNAVVCRQRWRVLISTGPPKSLHPCKLNLLLHTNLFQHCNLNEQTHPHTEQQLCGDPLIKGIHFWNPQLLDTGIHKIKLWFCTSTSRFCQMNTDDYISKPPDGWERWDLCGMNHIMLLYHGLLGSGQALNEGLGGFCESPSICAHVSINWFILQGAENRVACNRNDSWAG